LLQNGATFQLSCDSYAEREEWIESINLAIAAMRKPTVETNTEISHSFDPMQDDSLENFQQLQMLAENCQAYGPGLFGAEAGQSSQFMIQLYDNDGVPLARGGVPFTVSLSDDECLYYIKVNDNNNGTYSGHFVVSRPSKYLLHIRLNDDHDISGSPFEIEVLPSQTVASKCSANGDALTYIYAGTKSTFNIVARDAYGNMKRRGGDPFEVGVMGSARLHSLQDNGDGTYTCSIEAQDPTSQPHLSPPNLSIVISLHGKQIAGSPFHSVINFADARKKNGLAGSVLLGHTAMSQPFSGSLPPAPPSSFAASTTSFNHTQNYDPQNTPFDEKGGASLGGNEPPNRLERARLRAMQAKGEFPMNFIPPPEEDIRVRSNPPPSGPARTIVTSSVPPQDNNTSNGQLRQRLGKLDLMAHKLGASGSTHSQSPAQTHPVSIDSLYSQGMGTPPEAVQRGDDMRLWTMTHEALTSQEVIL
jgi:hypothetical protein